MFALFLHHHHLSTPPLAVAVALDAFNLAHQPGHEPLPSIEGCGLDLHRLGSPLKQGCSPGPQPLLPFLKGCEQLSLARRWMQGGRKMRGTH